MVMYIHTQSSIGKNKMEIYYTIKIDHGDCTNYQERCEAFKQFIGSHYALIAYREDNLTQYIIINDHSPIIFKHKQGCACIPITIVEKNPGFILRFCNED